MGKAHTAFIGIGANLGDPFVQCGQALQMLANLPDNRLVACSSFYENPPVVAPGENPKNAPFYVNAVCRMETKLNPPDLLQALQGVEKAMGRIRDRKWEPRLIDLDLLSYDELVSEEGALRLPHPEIQNRFFVLIPLTEIAPDWIHPKLGQTAQALLEQLTAIQRPEGIKKIPSTLA